MEVKAQWGLRRGKYHRSPQPPPPGLPADCRTALGARPQKLQSGHPWAAAAAASPPCVRRLLCSWSSPHVRLHVGAPRSCCSAPGSALSCQVATGQPGASEEGGWMPFVCLAFFPVLLAPLHSRGALKRQNRALHISDLHEKEASLKNERERGLRKRDSGVIKGDFKMFFLVVGFHSWGCMNGAS